MKSVKEGDRESESESESESVPERRSWNAERVRVRACKRAQHLTVWRSHWNLCFENEMSKCKAQQRAFPHMRQLGMSVCVGVFYVCVSVSRRV